ncbi:MAG: DNA polymerase III subunit alpha [Planctomycetota bacterium]|nr:DNA polymerase III subunit alpha [Planctomycetota bacterium]
MLGLCRAGALRRYPAGPPEGFEARLERELSLIERKNFTGYFLVVWDIVQFARRRSAPVAGRGSGASSLVAYLLGITNVCPLAHRIPFERFLNEGRQDYPDLDVDFCWRIRDEVLDYALARWGGGRAAMVCTHGMFQTASAIRETAKAFGMSDEQISTVVKEGEWEDGRGSQIVELARWIEGLLHTISVHPGGIVIAPEGVDAHSPLQPAAKGVNVTQYDKDGVEAVGLVKIDLLGNRSLSTIRAATDLVAARTGERLDIESLPAGDGPTIAMLQAGDTVGCNQLESPAMRSLLRAIRPAGTADLMKALALIRPGAASLGMKDAFIRRHRGLEPVPPIDPRVDAVLADTHGVMLYEDDVMQTAAALLGVEPARADRFRKAVQKCRDDADRLALSREFLAGCRAAGVADACAKDLWVQMAKFNAYSFCRAHAGSYAVPAYAVAYLTRHWPREFWTAALNNNQSMYPPRVYVEQAKRMGVRFALPDVNRSEAEFCLDGDVIRAGLGRVAGVGPGAAAAVLAARRGGPFTGLCDFAARTRLPKPAVRALVLCGAMDCFTRPRPTLMLELALCHGGPAPGALLTTEPALPIGRDFDPGRKFLDEWNLLGFSVGPHMLSLYRPGLTGLTGADSRGLGALVGRTVVIAGMLEARRLTRTQAGREVLFLTLDDEYGLFEATVFPAAARELPRTFDAYGPYAVSGKVERQYDSVGIAAERVVVFSQQTAAKPQAVTDVEKRICRTGSNI